jgi:hypothetical protein
MAPKGATALWKDILSTAFASLGSFSFTSSLDELQLQLGMLSALTAEPKLLRLLAAILMAEVVELNTIVAAKGMAGLGRGWEKQALLGPLLSGSGWIDPLKVEKAAHRGGQLDGLLPQALADVRGYPDKRCAAMI